MNASTQERKVTMDQFAELVSQIQAGRITRRHVTELLRNPDRLIDWEDDAQFNINVDYRKSYSDMIVTSQMSPTQNFLKEFPPTGVMPHPPAFDGEEIERQSVGYTVVLCKVKLGDGERGIRKQLEEMNLKPVFLEHLLALVAKWPTILNKFAIIGLCGDSERVFCMKAMGGKYYADVYDLRFGADTDKIRVLAIKDGGYPGWTA